MKLAAIFLAVPLGALSVILWWHYRQVQDELHTERTIKGKLATEVEALQGGAEIVPSRADPAGARP